MICKRNRPAQSLNTQAHWSTRALGQRSLLLNLPRQSGLGAILVAALLTVVINPAHASSRARQMSQVPAPVVHRASIADAAGIPEVAMNEYMMTDANHFPLIESSGASTCVLVTLWDAQTSVGVLAHVSASIDSPNSFARIFSELAERGIPSSRLQARIIGGLRGGSEPTVAGIEMALRSGRVTVVERDVLPTDVPTLQELQQNGLFLSQSNASTGIRSIVLDLRTGQAYDYNETVQSSLWSGNSVGGESILRRVHESL